MRILYKERTEGGEAYVIHFIHLSICGSWLWLIWHGFWLSANKAAR